jgi:hypothetical protein
MAETPLPGAAAAPGARTFEYNRQPQGQVNYMITIGADGKMSALRQVLTPQNFEKVLPGMRMEQVRKMLGKPMKVTPYALKQETHYDWRYLNPPVLRVFSRWCLTPTSRSRARRRSMKRISIPPAAPARSRSKKPPGVVAPPSQDRFAGLCERLLNRLDFCQEAGALHHGQRLGIEPGDHQPAAAQHDGLVQLLEHVQARGVQ